MCKQIPSQAITFYLSVCTLYVRVHCTTIAIAMQSNCVASFEKCLIDNRLHFEIPFHSNYHCVNAKAYATIPTCIHFYFTLQLAKKKPTSITKILGFFLLRRNHILQCSQFMSWIMLVQMECAFWNCLQFCYEKNALDCLDFFSRLTRISGNIWMWIVHVKCLNISNCWCFFPHFFVVWFIPLQYWNFQHS